MLKKLTYLSLFLLLYSCKKGLQFDLPQTSPSIVLNCLFRQDSTWKVRLYESGVPQGQSFLKEIKNAQIEIFEDGKPFAKLTKFIDKTDLFRQKTGFYTEPDGLQHTPKCGHLYTIKVKAAGFPDITASDFLLQPPLIENFEGKNDKIEISKVENGPSGVGIDTKVSFNLQKKQNIRESYYGSAFVYESKIKPISNYVNSSQKFPEDTSYVRVQGISFDSMPYNLPGYYVTGFYVYPDSLFKGNKPLLKCGFRYINFRRTAPEEVYFEMYQISPTYYDYVITYEKQLLNKNDAFSEAQPVSNNIEGGYGIFASYATRRFPIKLK